MTARITVVYYSATGKVARLAAAVAAGAEAQGAQVRLRTVPETAPPAAIERNAKWAAFVAAGPSAPLVELADLEWAGGLALGSPTRFGGPASQLKSFLDTTGGLWAQGLLADKVGTSFTSASTAHGGLESTLLAINNHFYHWGTLIMPLGYAGEGLMESGNPYGGSFVARRSADEPDDIAVRAAAAQGARLAGLVDRLNLAGIAGSAG